MSAIDVMRRRMCEKRVRGRDGNVRGVLRVAMELVQLCARSSLQRMQEQRADENVHRVTEKGAV